MDKLFINYSGNIESFKRLGLEETYKKCIVFIEKGGAIYTHNTYYAGPDIIKSIQEALGELQLEVMEGDYVSSIKQVNGKIEATMGTFEGRDSKILEDSKSYTDELKRDVTKAIATEYMRATRVEKSLSERIDSHLDITERALSEKADKDSVYDKDQIDLKLTGVYKIKGSCTFEELPETNKVGDVYNITNSFTLDEEEHTAGTNIVYTESGWDVLAGIFDTSAIESDIQRVSNLLALEVVRAIKAENDLEDKINEGAARAQEKELELDKKFDDYLPLSGGIITNTSNTPIKIKTTSGGWSGLAYANKDGIKGHIGVWQNGDPVYVPSDVSKGCTILHEGNYSNYALPLTGGTVTGRTSFYTKDSTPVIVSSNSTNAAIAFKNSNAVDYAYLYYGPEGFIVTDDGWHNAYKIYHEGNFNPDNYLPLTGGTISSEEKSPLKITGGNYGEVSIGFFKNGKEMSVFGYTETQGTFMWDNISHSRLYLRNNKLFFTPSANAAAETIWHSGNDGSGSGLDADKLDGLLANQFLRTIDPIDDINDINLYKLYSFVTDLKSSCLNVPLGFSSGEMIYIAGYDTGFMLVSSYMKDLLIYRRGTNALSTSTIISNDWKTIAFTDSDITGNAASASYVKLLDEITTDSFYNYIGDYAKGITAFSNKTDQAIGNIGLYDTVLNVGSTGDRFFRLLSKKNGDLRYQTPVNNANAWGPERTIIDSENVAQHTKRFYDLTGGAFIPRDADLNDYTTAGTYRCTYNDVAVTILNSPTTDAFVLYVYYPNGVADYCQKQEIVNWINYKRWTRRHLTSADEWSDWQLTQDNLNTYNAPTATKLQTPVKLWGNDFDGSSSVTESIYLKNNSSLYIADNQNNPTSVLVYNNNNVLTLGYSSSGKGHGTSIFGSPVTFYTGTDRTYRMIINSIGNVGIGTANPQYKLDVNGSINLALGNAVRAGDKSLIYASNVNNAVWYGLDAEGDGITYYCGNKIILKTSGNNVMVVNGHGNVTIGNSDLASTNYKLYVDGTIKATDKILINDDEVITEAPSDTTMYARSNKSWVPISGYEDLVSYGVKWEKNATSPICTRIGNPLLHKELPIQSQFRGCIYDYKTGVFKYWLNPNDWSLKEDGTASVLDGTDGDVCVHTPKFYGKSGEDNGYYWVRISLTKIDDSWIEIPEMYIGAYRSTVDRTNSLARSIVNTSALYRGGINSADYDQYLETDPFRTLLGKPATNISRATMRTYCRNNNSEMLSYEQYKWIFYWAYVIEYANFNALAGYNEELTTEGYRQGGLGNGMTTWDDSNWNLYNYYNPITPCGYGNNIGNFTGIKTVTVPAYTGRDGATSVTEKSYLMPRWRGFDNPFGDIWTNLDGVIILGYVDLDGNPSYKEVYTTTNPTKYGDTLENMLDMNIAGIEIYKAGYTLEFDLRETAEIIPSAVGASTTTGKCDYHYVLDSSTNYTNLRTLLVGGHASNGGSAGPGFFASSYGVGLAGHNVGFRMVKEIKD